MPPTAERMPGAVPAKTTPGVRDGEVTKIVAVGDQIIAGGLFTQVSDPLDGGTYTRTNLFAFDAATGLVSQTFNPQVDGQVQQLLPGPTPDTVYVAGDFNKINGRGPGHVQLLDVNTGQAVTTFKAPATNGGVATMELLPGNRLFIGGFFTKLGGSPHGQLASLNATTGAVDPFIDITVAQNHSPSPRKFAPVGARESGLTPAGDRMVVIGNFRTADGLARDQIVMVDLTGATAAVSTSWATTRYTSICSRSFDSYMRDVEMSPDGSFFVVATTGGGGNTSTLCDAAARFETYAATTPAQPTWTDHTGNDTLWGVEITRSAVYVGGHMRWMNNPNGSDRAAQASVPRPGLVALDPETGLPLKWNPGRNPRGEAVYEVYETDAGVWITSDTEFIGDNRYRRPRIAFFPYDEGSDTASKKTGALPGSVYVAGPNGESATSAKVVEFDGATIASQASANTGHFDWTNVRGSVMIGRTLFYGQSNGYLYRRSFDGTSFGPAAQVNPYLDPAWNTVPTGSGPAGQTYAGVLPTWYSQLTTVTGMFYAKGRMYYTRSGSNTLNWRWFSPDSGIIGATEFVAAGGNVPWSSTKGMFLDGDTLYFVGSSTGQLSKIGFAGGAPTGTYSLAEGSTDWRGKAFFLASVSPNLAPTAAFTSECTGTICSFDAGGSADADGSISSYEWSFSDGDQAGGATPEKDFATSGTFGVTLTVTDDGGLTSTLTQQVIVEQPNQAPVADFSSDCAYLECTFDAATSTDADGTVTSYVWDFGDGATGTDLNPQHTFASPGTYPVSLVVTDDDGDSATLSRSQVVLGAPAAGTVAYVGGASAQGNLATPNVTAPDAISPGDRLLLSLSVNVDTRVLSEPTGITGWTVLGTTTSGSMQTRVYTKVASAGDAGRKVAVPMSGAAKAVISIAASAGVEPGSVVSADFAETVNQASHTTPTIQAPAGSWVVSYWADKSSSTTGFTLPGSVSGRQALCNAGGGRICAALADSGGSVPTGEQAGLTATADSANATATTWSVVLGSTEVN